MRSRFGSVSFLLLIFIGLAVVYWFGFKDKTPPAVNQPVATRESVSLVALDVAQVQEISWNYQTTKAKMSHVSDSEWKLVEPSIVADGAQLTEYARSALDIRGENKYPFTQVSREDAGLNSPTLTISIVTKDNKAEKVIVGKETLDKEFYYASKDGLDFSTLLSSYLVENLKKDPYSLTPLPSASGLKPVNP